MLKFETDAKAVTETDIANVTKKSSKMFNDMKDLRRGSRLGAIIAPPARQTQGGSEGKEGGGFGGGRRGKWARKSSLTFIRDCHSQDLRTTVSLLRPLLKLGG